MLLNGIYYYIWIGLIGLNLVQRTNMSDPSSFKNFSVSVEIESPSCEGLDGQIDLIIDGGQMPYSIEPDSLFNLNAGTYNIIVSDATNATYDTTIVLVEENDLTVFVDVLDEITCSGGGNADAIINVGGGSGDYLVMIDDNPSVSEISPGIFETTLSGGSYGITVTDNVEACILEDNFLVGQASAIIITTTINAIDSCSGRILDLSYEVSGGSPPYVADVQNVTGGVLVSVIDNENCEESVFVADIEVDNALVISSLIVTPADPDDDNAAIDVTVSGGNPPYAYEWRNMADIVISTDEDIEELLPGIYTFKVSDSKGCTITSGDIEVGELVSTESLSFNDDVKIFPNPLVGSDLVIQSLDKIDRVDIYDFTGKSIDTVVEFQSDNNLTLNLNGLAAGPYILRMRINNAWHFQKIIK